MLPCAPRCLPGTARPTGRCGVAPPACRGRCDRRRHSSLGTAARAATGAHRGVRQPHGATDVVESGVGRGAVPLAGRSDVGVVRQPGWGPDPRGDRRHAHANAAAWRARPSARGARRPRQVEPGAASRAAGGRAALDVRSLCFEDRGPRAGVGRVPPTDHDADQTGGRAGTTSASQAPWLAAPDPSGGGRRCAVAAGGKLPPPCGACARAAESRPAASRADGGRHRLPGRRLRASQARGRARRPDRARAERRALGRPGPGSPRRVRRRHDTQVGLAARRGDAVPDRREARSGVCSTRVGRH